MSVSVDLFFNPASTRTQCDVAKGVRSNPNCCSNKSTCNEPARLQDALGQLGISRLRGVFRSSLDFDEIHAEIDKGRPVCVRIGWDHGGGHFVVLDACQRLQSGEEMVHVLDPLYAGGTWYLDEFTSFYQGDGQWTATFFVQ